jgi:flagellar motor switch protein FliN/FliY
MPDDIKPDESLEEQAMAENQEGTPANTGTDQPDDAADQPAMEEADHSAEVAVAEQEGTGEGAVDEDIQNLSESMDGPVDEAESPVDSEDEFPDLSDVKMEETMANPAEFQQLSPSPGGSSQSNNIDLLLDVKMPVSIELGRTEMPISEVLTLGPGSVVELDKLAGEPVDLLVNDKIIAKGEVVVVDENFGVRVTMLMSPEERLKSLAKQ